MALERFLRLPPDQRISMLEIAARMFAEHGYEGTSYNELLREVGMGKSQAYYYFADKADFFITAIAAVYEEFYTLCAKLPEPNTADTFWSQVEKLHLIGFNYQVENPIAARLSLAALRSPVRFQLSDALINREGTTKSHYQYWIRLGQKLGAVRKDLSEELLVEMSINQSLFVDEWFAQHHPQATLPKRKKLASEFTGISKRMFRP